LKILYSIGTKFGGTGIGRVAAKSLTDIAQKHELSIAAADFEGAVPAKSRTVKIKRPVRWPLTEKKQYRLKRAIAFDSAVLKFLDAKIDLFCSWNGHCLDGLKKAKSLGITTIVVRASSHMLTQMELLKEEYDKHGLTRQIELQEMIDRSVEEYGHADYIQVPSEFVKRSFLDRGFSEDRLIEVPFGVDSSVFKPADISDSEFRLLFVGRIGLRKGVQYLLEAWKRLSLPGAELLLIGNVEPGFEKILQPYRDLPGLALTGFVKDPVEQFARSSLFVFPSIEEGSALVTYEAMASSLPVLTTFNSGSLVRDGIDGFIVPIRDVDALCEKIETLYKDRKLAGEMGRSAREFIAQYTWERHSRTLAGYFGGIEEKRSNARA
jgi:glycosyltransferase involved in cell wall biosynthesis